MTLLMLLLASAAPCEAPPPGKWPSLALRAGEVQPLVARPSAGPLGVGQAGATATSTTPGAAATPTPVPAPPPALADAATREVGLTREVDAYEKRLRAQLTEIAAARTASGADAVATVELQRTRLDRLGSQAADLRDSYNALAGDLARAAAAGADVSVVLLRVGAGIDRVEALRAEQAAARGPATTPN